MAHPLVHAKSSARKFGGVPDDYVELHSWFDQTKVTMPDVRHRALLHNAFGIYLAEQQFGLAEENRILRQRLKDLGHEQHGLARVYITRPSDGKQVPIRPIAEQHVTEDCGYIPTVQTWLEKMPMELWMIRSARPLVREQEALDAAGAV